MRMHPTVPNAKRLTSPTLISSASPGSNNPNNTPANHTITPATGPACLKLYQPLHATSSTMNATATTLPSSSSNPAPKISIIDKVVDHTKSKATEVRQGIDSVWGGTKETRQKEARINEIGADAQRYERRRAREDDWRREEINRERKERAERKD